jgi:uncharacterized protein (DUF2132 family)
MTTIPFDGADYVPARDDQRLTDQLGRVWQVMASGSWQTLRQIAVATGDPEPSISAQLRHLRKPRFGAHTVERNYIGNGLYAYRLIPNMAKPQPDMFTA